MDPTETITTETTYDVDALVSLPASWLRLPSGCYLNMDRAQQVVVFDRSTIVYWSKDEGDKETFHGTPDRDAISAWLDQAAGE